MLLTIITINFNNKDGLRETIKSVLSQDSIAIDNFEYIIIDGGSTDGSVDVIKEFAESSNYPLKISKWISEKDTGIYNAINKGIKLASGDIIGLANSGDTVIQGAYSDILNIHEKNPDSILYGAISFMKNGIFQRVAGVSSDFLTNEMICHPASFVPSQVYEKYGLYDESYRSSADWDLFLTFYQKGVPFLYINKLIINFDLSGISNTNSKIVKKENKRLLYSHGIKNKLTIGKVASLILPGFCVYLLKRLLKKS